MINIFSLLKKIKNIPKRIREWRRERMNKPFYSDYIRHAMRFYARNRKPSLFRTYADRLNWLACDRAIKTYSDRDKDILTSVYGGYDTLPDNVYEVAKHHHINQNIIWDMMKKFEKEVAQQRDLI